MDSRGSEPPWPKFFFLLIIFFLFTVGPHSSKTLGPLRINQPSQPNPISHCPTQKLNKNSKNIHNGDCILAKKLFYQLWAQWKGEVCIGRVDRGGEKIIGVTT